MHTPEEATGVVRLGMRRAENEERREGEQQGKASLYLSEKNQQVLATVVVEDGSADPSNHIDLP